MNTRFNTENTKNNKTYYENWYHKPIVSFFCGFITSYIEN